MLTYARAHELFSYDAETGQIRQKVSRCRAGKAGALAGGVDHEGYVKIKVDGRTYGAHRIAWMMVFGDWPKQLLDHINGDTGDNRIMNLRPATNSQNCANGRRRKTNKAGFKGVCKARRSPKWIAQVFCKGKNYRLGRFDTPEEAHNAYMAAARRLHGEFARAA